MRISTCKACYAIKRRFQPSAGVYQGCIQCRAGETKRELRECPSSKYTMNTLRPTTGPSALGLYLPEPLLSGSEPINSDPVLFDDRGFDISSRTRRRPKLRDSPGADASVSIGAIQFAGATNLVREGLLQPSELVELHHLFITRWNPCVLILDPCLHTLQYLVQSELLLSVVLAVAAQEYHTRPQLYEQLIRHARAIAGRELLETPTVDTVQSLILLSLFPDWGASFDQNRSWLDLGLALDLANQLEIEKVASRFDPYNTSPTERNIFRTWMICHNLDAITSLVFDRPSLLGPMPLEDKRWPKKPSDSYEGMVGVLAEPLQLLELHIKQQSLNELLYGADAVRGINRESSSSPQLLDSRTITYMEEETTGQRTLCANEKSGSLCFWFHMAKITTAYSRLLLPSRYLSADQNLHDPEYRSNMIDSATSILESYNDLFDSYGYAKYAPGCFFTYGILATAVIYKLIGNTGPDISEVRVTALIERFSSNLQLSPTATGTETNTGIFIQTLKHLQRDQPHRAGGMSESLSSQEPIVPMLTTVFPGWWRLYL
ncbi:fungal specific transcription factor domain protein [Rhizoctonia solani 123E]|uniref:Fungal specific transcription factor domain protein n=1 Tax=Rhizoctonia solani 123E TaxID=1423351 RepID=A0A074SJT6_9AGAM|nr:fungal specific transcription factor domain protein [Rhizoctonia solani 123E]